MMDNWNKLLAEFQEPQLLQTLEWSKTKKPNGWEPHFLKWYSETGEIEALALVLERGIRSPVISATIRMLYVPKGPILKNWDDAELRNKILKELQAFAHKRSAFVISMDPEVLLGTGIPGEGNATTHLSGKTFVEELKNAGWKYANQQPQFKNTVFIDLKEDEETILARMKQKTRYNIRLAERKGVKIRQGNREDFDLLAHMYAETSIRDGFVIRSLAYYKNMWEIFYNSQMLVPLIAEVEGEPVAALMLYLFGNKAWYITGMSTSNHRNLMPTYLLQWEAILRAKQAGCDRYDLWGAPNEFSEEDSMWGVFRFKEGLGGTVARHIGAWELPTRPLLYQLYQNILPRILNIMRKRGRAETQKNYND